MAGRKRAGGIEEVMNFDDPFWQDRFHWCAIRAYYEALCEGKQKDSEYVRKRAYAYYEDKPLTKETDIGCQL